MSPTFAFSLWISINAIRAADATYATQWNLRNLQVAKQYNLRWNWQHRTRLGYNRAQNRGGDNRWCQNFNPSTPKPDSRHNYKTFCLKDHILLSKKRPCPSNITCHWNSIHLAKGGHWEKRHQLNIMTPIQLFIIYMTSKPPQASARHPQISSRHCQTPTDTIQTPTRHTLFLVLRALEEKAIYELSWPIWICANIFGFNTSPDTLRLHLDTPRHTSR